MLVIFDREYQVVSIHEMTRAGAQAAIEREGTDTVKARALAKKTRKPYKAPRRQEGALEVREFQRLAKQVWPVT